MIMPAQEKKKPTNAQLQRRIKNAVIHLDKTKETQSIYFSDKGLRLIIDETQDYAIVETNYHQHIFNRYSSSGISYPFMYLCSFAKIALSHSDDIKTEDGYSYHRLLNLLSDRRNNSKEAQHEHSIVWYVDKWLTNIFSPLYSIGLSDAEMFNVVFDYLFEMAKCEYILSEKKEDVTNKQYVEGVIEKIRGFISSYDEYVIFPKKTDEEVMQAEIDALQEELYSPAESGEEHTSNVVEESINENDKEK